MAFILDNNILVRWADPDDARHTIVINALKMLKTRNELLGIMPQALREFWVVATRPRVNLGLEMTSDEAARYLEAFHRLFTFLPDTSQVYHHWRALVVKYRVSGKEAHDAGYVAAMLTHDVRNILTLDADDFRRYQDLITVHAPAQFADSSPDSMGDSGC